MDKAIHLRDRLKTCRRTYTIRSLSLQEKESLEQLLMVLRKGKPDKKEALKATIEAYFHTLPGGIWEKK